MICESADFKTYLKNNLITEVGRRFRTEILGGIGTYEERLRSKGIDTRTLKVEIPGALWRRPEEIGNYLLDNYSPDIDDIGIIEVEGKEIPNITCISDEKGNDIYLYDDLNAAGICAKYRPVPRGLVSKSDVILITSGEPKFNISVAKAAQAMGKKVAFDLGYYQLTPYYLQEVPGSASVILGNKEEINTLLTHHRKKELPELFDISNILEEIVLFDKLNIVATLYTRGGRLVQNSEFDPKIYASPHAHCLLFPSG